MEEKKNTRDSGFKPEGERMAVSQSHGEPQNGRGHGRKGNMFSLGSVKSKKNDENKYPGGSWK